MVKVCIPCNAVMDGEVCFRCLDPNVQWRQTVEVYRDKPIMRYSHEVGYRADFGAKRSREVPTIEIARALVDYHHSPTKKNERILKKIEENNGFSG